MPNDICAEISDLLPAYALGALEAEEAARAGAHLPECPRCRAELEALQTVLVGLAHAAPRAQPPSRLRQRLLRHARASGDRRSRLRGQRWWAAVAAAILAIAVLGAQVIRLQAQLASLADAQAEQQYLLAIISDPEARRVRLSGPEGAEAYLIAAPGAAIGALVVHRLPPPPQGQVYQVWLLDSQADRVSAALFSPDEAGAAAVIVRAPAALADFDAIGVTNEPAGGSPGPTGTRVLGASIGDG